MSDTTTPADLTIPEATYHALGALGMQWDSWAHLSETARAIAAPVVAAELRRIAEDGTGWAIGTHLRARADELDGGAQ